MQRNVATDKGKVFLINHTSTLTLLPNTLVISTSSIRGERGRLLGPPCSSREKTSRRRRRDGEKCLQARSREREGKKKEEEKANDDDGSGWRERGRERARDR